MDGELNCPTLKIIPVIPLPRFERGTSGLPFAYSISYMFQNGNWFSRKFSIKKLIFSKLSIHFVCDYITD